MDKNGFDELKEIEARLSKEIANNDMIMFMGLSALIILLGIFIAANEVFPKETLREYSLATITSIAWFIVRQELMIHRAGGYITIWRKVLEAEERQNISPNTIRVRPDSWEEWRTGTWFRKLTLIFSDLLSGAVGFVWLFRQAKLYPYGDNVVFVTLITLIALGLIMIPITIVLAKKDPKISFS